MDLKERFLKYVSYDTQSSEESTTFPSTEKQKVLLAALRDEMEALGMIEVTMDQYGYVMGTVPASKGCENAPVIGFIAHVDTSPDMSGKEVKPRVIDEYDGGDIALNGQLTMRVADFPELAFFKGHTLIHTDGTTLLGADDKAGVAEIMTAAEYLMAHPEVKHGKIRIGFTPDEEVGRGVDFFDVKAFGADFAYTVDGGMEGELEYENFNAASAKVEIQGRNVHPGYAKNKMINAIDVACELQGLLPASQRPQFTEGYEGFYHCVGLNGTVENASVSYIIRDHDAEKFEQKKVFMWAAVDLLKKKYGDQVVTLTLKDQYYNMRKMVEPHPQVIDKALKAMEMAGVKPLVRPIRGGTDGARLSFMGLPCPNLFTGGMNFHGKFEYCSLTTMRKAQRMAAMAEEAARRGVEIVAFPELGVTAYTCGDLLLQQTLLDAADEALERLVRATRKLPLTLIAGAPLRHGSTLYNCAVVFTQGKVLGVVPKTYIPDYGEFYENRWFASGAGISDEHIAVAGQQADFGADLTFEVNGAEFGIEICEDLWTAAPPSSQLALNGAKVIFNLSASPESVGKHAYLRQLVAQQSGRAIAAYVYCSAGFGESTTDLVFAGNAVIAENGCILREAARFSPDEQLVVADVDIERLEFERRRNTSFRANEGATENTVIEMEIPEGLRGVALDRDIDPMPFVPKDEADRSERCEEIFRIQSHGLAQRMVHTRSEKAVVGISGGLDSTLALLVTARTFDFLHLDRAGIIGITMPGFGTTDRTYNNALELMRGLGVTIREIPIRDACTQHFQDIGLDPGCRGAAYENAQARERTQILMDVANMEGGLVIGTGDLSELALGWATYNGDQMSMYGVNASVPKTLVRHLVKWAAATEQDAATRATLLDIIDTPVSPELLPADDNGKIAQKTEDLVGPYELHDFFLYNFLRAGYGPAKILLLAEQAFDGSYDRAAILRWLTVFVRRFFTQQFKRSAMPDGPKVGSVTLSPRGDWRMPSDASAAAWLRELDTL